MTRRLIVPLIFGLAGAAVLISLGLWQLARLEWKEAIIARIESRLSEAPVALPVAPSEAADEYLRVAVEGTISGPAIHILTSIQFEGPGYRVIVPMVLPDARRIMVDLGFIGEDEKSNPQPTATARIEGTLLWPDETDSFTPVPNLARNIWFAREIDAMAAALGAEPVLVVLSASNLPQTAPTPMPVTVNITNNHQQYSRTWFALALVWLAMTGYWIIRILRKTA